MYEIEATKRGISDIQPTWEGSANNKSDRKGLKLIIVKQIEPS